MKLKIINLDKCIIKLEDLTQTQLLCYITANEFIIDGNRYVISRNLNDDPNRFFNVDNQTYKIFVDKLDD